MSGMNKWEKAFAKLLLAHYLVFFNPWPSNVMSTMYVCHRKHNVTTAQYSCAQAHNSMSLKVPSNKENII